MLKEVKQKRPDAQLNLWDKAVAFFSPQTAVKRLRSRLFLEFLSSYEGARTDKRSLKQWTTMGYDADSDILPDLEKLRERSRDLIRNNPLANGAIKTKVTNVVGTGLRLQSRIDRDVLSMSDEQADVWEATTEREWRLFWDSKDTDVARTCNGADLTRQIYRQVKENGDVFVLLPKVKRLNSPYDLKLQVIEADRVCNKDNESDSETLAGGIEKDKYGAPVAYHIMKNHPGNASGVVEEWEIRPAFGSKTGLRNVIHLFGQLRPGQSRGVPDLAAVIEPLKQLGRYTEAEIMAAVVSGMFTVFIESETGNNPIDITNIQSETGQTGSDTDYQLGNGLIMELGQGEKVHDSNPGRPNTSFDPFVQAILRQIGVALQLPFEVLIKHFTASYSAARAALLELWKYVLSERRWLSDNFLKIVYEIWMYEAVSTGRIKAPGFFSDPAIKAAYLGSAFVGPSKGQIDELKEVKAANERVAGGFSTISEETAEMTGGDWEKNHKQQVKERKARLKDGLIMENIEEDGNQFE